MAKKKNNQGRESFEAFAGDESLNIANRGAEKSLRKKAQEFLGNPKGDNEKQRPPARSAAPMAGSETAIEAFKFLECDPLIPGEEPEPCPICQENPFAYVPDFTLMENGEVFFDGKRCLQSIVLTVPSPILEGPDYTELNNPAYILSKKAEGIRLILDYYNKSDIATVYYYVENDSKEGAGDTIAQVIGGPAGEQAVALSAFIPVIPNPIPGYQLVSEERNVVEELLQYTEYEFRIPIQQKAQSRILISIPVEYLDRCPDKAITEPKTIFQTDLEVTINGDDFKPFFRRVNKAFRFYHKQLQRWSTLEGGKLVELTDNGEPGPSVFLNLDTEANLIDTFQNTIENFIEDIGLSVDQFKPAKLIEKIVLKFEPKEDAKQGIKLKEIILNKPGCPDIVFNEVNADTRAKFIQLLKQAPMGESRTLYYIGALPEMDIDLTALTPVPWLEFITKYTWPGLQVFYGDNSNSMLNDPTMAACLASSTFNAESDPTVDQFMSFVSDTALSLPDAILDKFSQNTCLTREDKFKNPFEDFDSIEIALEEAKKRIAGDNPYLQDFFDRLEASLAITATPLPKEIRGTGLKKGLQNLIWEDFFDRLKWCGWISLMLKAVECVSQNLGVEDAQKALVEASFNAMETAHVERVLIGLPPEAQQAVFDSLEEELKKLPAPWDPSYIPAIPTGSMSNTGSAAPAIPTVSMSNTGSAAGQSLFGTSYSSETGQFSFGSQTKGSGGSYGTALGNVQKDIVDAYRNAALQAVGADVLLEQINKLPGAPIVSNFIKHIPCKPVPPIAFDPRLDSFLNTLALDFNLEECKFTTDITTPKLLRIGIGNPLDLLAKLAKMALEAILEAALAIVVKAIILILEKLFSLACDILSTLGANLLDLIDGSDKFKDLLKENMCPDATDEQLYDSLKNIFASVGGPESDCLRTLANDEMAKFIQDVSLMMTQGQLIQLLEGNPSKETLQLAKEVAAVSDSQCIRDVFGDGTAFNNLFPAVAKLIPNLQEIKDNLGSFDLNRPIYPCPPEAKNRINEIKCNLLQEKGLSPEQCREELAKSREQALSDLNDLLNNLQNGPLANFPPLVGEPGECANDGFFPAIDPMQADLSASITESLFQKIEIKHLNDLLDNINPFTGQAGVLNMILSDTKGRSLKRHNTWVRFFGSPLANELGFFESWSDDAIRKPTGDGPVPGNDNVPINIYGEELSGDLGGKQTFFGYSEGGFPPTVGAWMAKQLRELNPEFKTIITPEGFATLGDAKNAYNTIDLINKSRIANRSRYVEGFINEFELTNNPSMLGMVQNIRVALSGSDLFIKSEDPKKQPDSISKDSAQEIVRNILNGEKVKINGETIANASENTPSKWSTFNKAFVETEGEIFTTFYDAREEYDLVTYPDTSSADIRLKYNSYPENSGDESALPGWEYEIQLDYNMTDDEGNIIPTNEYNLKIVETSRTSGAGGAEARKERRKLEKSGELPPDSILEEGEYVFTKHDITTKNIIDGQIEKYISSLEISDVVKDSYQIETFYRFLANRILEATDDQKFVKLEILQPEFRDYFAKGSGGKDRLYDRISNAFIKRISTVVSTGKVDYTLQEEPEVENEPGFLEPEIPDTTVEPELSNTEEKIADGIDLDAISPAFHFGYDPYKEPEVIFLDNETYGGLLGRLFPDKVPPPFYVGEPKYTGWMDIMNILVPEVNGCEPASKQIFNLEDLIQKASDLANQLLPDERLNYDVFCSQEAPFDKIMNTADAADLDSAIRAIIRIYLVDVFIRGIPSFTIFALNSDNFGGVLESFMADRIKQGLYDDGAARSGRTDDMYYYKVLEQCVNTIARKIKSGILTFEELNSEEREAFTIIEQKVLEFYNLNDGALGALSTAAIKSQSMFRRTFSTTAASEYVGLGAGSTQFSKTAAKKAKEIEFISMLEETEQYANVLFKRYIREEFEAVSELFNGKLQSSVSNIHHLFLLNDTWIRGGVFGGGPFDVMSNPNDSTTYNITTGVSTSVQSAFDKLGEIGDLLGQAVSEQLDEWPFVLEKYIMVEDKFVQPSEVQRKENLYNIININDWKEYIDELKSDGLEGFISDFWGNPEITGETLLEQEHTHEYRIDEEGNGRAFEYCGVSGQCHYHRIINGVIQEAEGDNGLHTHEMDIIGWKFGLRICYVPEKDKNNIFSSMIDTIGNETIMLQKAYKLANPEGGETYMIPLASVELPIPDQDFTLFEPDSYDVFCLIQELIKTPEYKTMFKYVFPLSTYNSMIALYTIMGFFDSIGNSGYPNDGGDMWEVPGGRRGKGFRKWVRGPGTFKATRRVARNIFLNLYDATQDVDFSGDSLDNNEDTNPVDNIRSLLRPKVNFEDGLRWWQRGRRITQKPFNLDGEEC